MTVMEDTSTTKPRVWRDVQNEVKLCFEKAGVYRGLRASSTRVQLVVSKQSGKWKSGFPRFQ